MSTLKIEDTDILLKETISRCPVCRKQKPAKVLLRKKGKREEVVMQRTCACHGTHESVISSDSRFYWKAQGNPMNESCCGSACSTGEGKDGVLGINALDTTKKGTIDKLSTCLALIEIVDSCNLACPTCFADSPVGTHGDKLIYKTFDDLTGRIQGVIDRKSHIEVLQFSGGEPTIHPDFYRLVKWVRSNTGIDYLLINTNGVRFAKDPEFVKEMGKLQECFDNIQLYLQFDGPQQEDQKELRGLDLRKTREQAIKKCASIGLPVTLAMTVTEKNLTHLWESVEYGLRFENVRGISFQPLFLSGRVPERYETKAFLPPVTVADVILGLNDQSNGKMSVGDFTPLPCGDPNCATIGWMFRIGTECFSPEAYGIDIAALQASLPNRVNYNLEDLKRCGCDNTVLGELMKKLEVKESNAFRIFIKHFMDVWTWDEDRIDRCCTHVIRPDGGLESFCKYYLGTVKEDKACC